MPETDTIPVSASIASTGLGIRYIGDYCFGYSGLIAVPGAGVAGTTMLNFTSGSGYIYGELSWHSESSTSADEFIVVKLNNLVVMQSRYSNAYYSSNDQEYKIIIPPQTEVLMLFGNDGGTDATFTFTGRVYGEA